MKQPLPQATQQWIAPNGTPEEGFRRFMFAIAAENSAAKLAAQQAALVTAGFSSAQAAAIVAAIQALIPNQS